MHAGADAQDGLHVWLVLDKDDQPMVAFLKVDSASAANNAVYFTRYDGTAWKTPVVVAASVGRVDSNSTKCGGPKLSRSSDAASWTTCGADDKSRQFLGSYVSAELASNGKVVMAFHTVNADTAMPSRFGRGIVLWREP